MAAKTVFIFVNNPVSFSVSITFLQSSHITGARTAKLVFGTTKHPLLKYQRSQSPETVSATGAFLGTIHHISLLSLEWHFSKFSFAETLHQLRYFYSQNKKVTFDAYFHKYQNHYCLNQGTIFCWRTMTSIYVAWEVPKSNGGTLEEE